MPNPPPKKLTLADAQEALRRLARPSGPVPSKVDLTPYQTGVGQRQIDAFKGLATGEYPLDDSSAAAASAEIARKLIGQGEKSPFREAQERLRKQLLGAETGGSDAYFTPPTINLGANLLDVIKHPTSIGGGVYEIGKDLALGLKDNYEHAKRVIDPSLEDKLFQRSRLTNAAASVPLVGNFVEPWIQAYKDTLAQTPYVEGDRNPGAKFRAALGATSSVASHLVGDPMKTIFTGKVTDSETGLEREATPAEKAKNFMLAGMLAKGVREGMFRKGGRNIIDVVEGDPVAGLLKAKAQTSGEMAATKGVSDLIKQQNRAKLPSVKGLTEDVHSRIVPEGETPPVETPSIPLTETTLPETPSTISEEPKAPQKTNYAYPSVADSDYWKAYEAADEEVQKVFSQPATMAPDVLKDYIGQVLLEPEMEKYAREMVETGTPISAAIFQTLSDERFQMNVPKFMEERGIDGPTAQKIVAGSMENTGHAGGQILQAYSQALDEIQASLVKPPSTAPLSEMLRYQQQVKTFERWREMARLPEWAKALKASGKLQSATKTAQGVERLRVGMMLSKLPTTIHIMQSQGLTSLVDAFDAFNTGLTSTVFDPKSSFTKEGLTRNWADLIGHATALGDMIRPGGRATITELLDGMPMVRDRLVSGLLGENDNTAGFFAARMKSAWNDIAQGADVGERLRIAQQDLKQLQEAGHFTKGSLLYDVPMAAADVLTIGLRAQEVAFRKYAFKARLDANLMRLGVKEADVLEMLRKAKVLDKEGNAIELPQAAGEVQIPEGLQIADVDTSIPPEIREAFVDAEVHALRSTWAATPDGWLGQMLKGAKIWNSVAPLQTSMFFSPFVRAMANNVMWQLHHNPLNIADMLIPEYRKAFTGAAEDGITLRKSRDIQRAQGEALTGLAMLTGMMHMQGGGFAGGFSKGPNPWTWTTGSPDNGDTILTHDIRPYPQLAEFSTLAAMINAKLKGEPNPVGLQDALEIFGNTRVGSVPVFNVLQEIRNAASSNDELAWESMWRELGNYVAPFGNIPQTLREDYGRMALEAGEIGANTILGRGPSVTGDLPLSADYRTPETTRQAPVGGLIGKTSPGMLPPKISPFTGKEVQEGSALAENSLLNLPNPPKTITPLEWLMTKTPGLAPSGLVKTYSNNEAQQMVNRYTGEIVNSKEFQVAGLSMQEYAKVLNRFDQPELTKFYMDLLLPAVRQLAETKAMVEDMQKSGTDIPPHFVDEQVAKLPTGGVPNFKLFWEELLRKRIESQRKPVLPSVPSTPQGAPQ